MNTVLTPPPSDPVIEKFCKTLSQAVKYYQKEGYEIGVCVVMGKKKKEPSITGVFYKASSKLSALFVDLMYRAITINNNP